VSVLVRICQTSAPSLDAAGRDKLGYHIKLLVAGMEIEIALNSRRKSIFFLSVICFALYVFPYLLSSKLIVNDEVGLNHFSSLAADSGTLKYVPEGDRIFGFPGFVPEQTVYTASGEAIPKQPPGFILLAAIAKAFTPGQFFLVLNPILGMVCVLLIYGIGRHFLGSDQSAFYAALLLASTPVFIHWTQMFYVDIANLTAFLLSIWCLLQSLETRRAVFLGGFGLSLGAMIWIRQSSVLLLIPIAMVLFLNRDRFRLEMYRLPAVCFGLAVVLLMVYNTQIYGSPFKTGYSMGHLPGYSMGHLPAASGTISSALFENFQLVTLSFELLWSHLKWLLPSFTLAFPPLILAFIGMTTGLKSQEKRNISILLWLTLLILFIFFASRATYGVARAELTLQSSFLRYLLPFFALLSIPTLWALEKLNKARFQWVCLIVLLNLSVASFAHFGIIHTILNRLYWEDVARFVVQNTNNKTVVISPYWSSVIFPDRLVYSLHPASREKLESTIDGILQKGYSVALIYHSSNSLLFETLDEDMFLEKVTGPQELNVLLRMLPVAIPSHVYPVKLYTILPNSEVSTD